MRSGLVTFLFLLIAFILQTTFFAHMFTLLAHGTGISDFAFQNFNFPFIAVIYLSLNRGRSSALIWAVIVGMLANAFGLAWGETTSFGVISIALIGSFLKGRVMLSTATSVMILVALFTVLEALFHLVLGKMVHGNEVLYWGQFGLVFRHVVLQTMVAPIVFYVLKGLDHWTGTMNERRAFPLTNF